MKHGEELTELVAKIFKTKWEVRKGEVVPEPSTIGLANDAVALDGTVLYADLAESTALVQRHKDWFAAEVYKAYLLCASEIIKNNGGAITAFDGDRVMGVFIGKSKNTAAAKCALQINYAVTQIVNPQLKTAYPESAFEVRQSVGVDASPLFVARTGVRGDNDLVWVGRAANYAAKLSALRDAPFASFITSDVFDLLAEESKVGGDPPRLMWTKFTWEETGLTAYKSAWHWKP